MRLLLGVSLAVAAAVAAAWWLMRPERVAEAQVAGIEPDLARGELVFHAAGCASCHVAPDAEGDGPPVLSGGRRFDTPAGVFHAPNISQDPDVGIGGWSRAEVVTAIMKGTSPDGRHYYPAFPYTAYGKADLGDIVSLAAYLETLPPDPTPSRPHELAFPFSVRAGLGAWKMLNVTDAWAVSVSGAEAERGRYLAEALGHCGECHTPRGALQGLDPTRWFAGAPNPSGRGRIPNITPAGLTWSSDDIVAYFETGFTPDFDVVGGSMTAVVNAYRNLPREDLEALAAYLKAVPAAESEGD